ncbi:SDR family oxidoreductase [Halobacterium sp. KA-6]|uniref:SDR family oxidoreductase n=1 Tax=Halobacterium sp. KA-6 TaxID=2896368 RepID=UPI001E3898AF|nr:SDR family oxidoreductase [Halobacterium sp. KA-6]MCD2205210.1 SDR family oxidoreductase [Halobacterium sp. KA-6]
MTGSEVAIITGAGSGIGEACARNLANSGYEVALMSKSDNAKQVADELGGEGIVGSVTSPEDIQALVKTTCERHGQIDVVVNSTGHPATGNLLDISDPEWHEGLDLVFMNVVRMARECTQIMAETDGGSIVNISTFSAYEPSLDFPVSSALRAALGSFTKMYADHYAEEDIRMNNILPGYVDSFDVSEESVESIPMRRRARTEEIADVVGFLASDEASYITGQNLRVDGGLTESI